MQASYLPARIWSILLFFKQISPITTLSYFCSYSSQIPSVAHLLPKVKITLNISHYTSLHLFIFILGLNLDSNFQNHLILRRHMGVLSGIYEYRNHKTVVVFKVHVCVCCCWFFFLNEISWHEPHDKNSIDLFYLFTLSAASMRLREKHQYLFWAHSGISDISINIS